MYFFHNSLINIELNMLPTIFKKLGGGKLEGKKSGIETRFQD